MRRHDCTVLALLLLAAASLPAAAQAPAPPDPADPCRVEPQQQPGQGAVSPEAAAPQEQEQLTETLDRCRSVLKPPPTGDDIAEQPDATGRTPVIRPGELPPQQ